jgi:predicted NAD/FAD-binding protein
MGFIIACFKNNKIKKVPLKLDSKERGLGIRNSQENHAVFHRENKSMPRRRKSCWHLTNLLARGQGNSLQRSTSFPHMSSPKHIYGNVVNTG